MQDEELEPPKKRQRQETESLMLLLEDVINSPEKSLLENDELLEQEVHKYVT